MIKEVSNLSELTKKNPQLQNINDIKILQLYIKQKVEFLCNKNDFNESEKYFKELEEILNILEKLLNKKENIILEELDDLKEAEMNLNFFIEKTKGKENIFINKMIQLSDRINLIRVDKAIEIKKKRRLRIINRIRRIKK